MLGLIHESYYTQEEENHGCHLMSTLKTGHAAEYTRLPISLALLLSLPLPWPHYVEDMLMCSNEIVPG